MSRAGAARPGRTFASLAGMLAAGAGIALLLALLALPLAALVLHATPASLVSKLRDPLVLDALRLSLATAAASTLLAVLLGLPVAWLLATRSFPLKRWVEVLVELPMVLPPTVAGFALLLAFGRAGLLGRELSALGIHLPFTTLGVVVAQVFMASPFFISSAAAGIASVDRRYLEIASTLRSSERNTLFRVVLPLSLPSLAAGATMCCARALGEFGATITFAGNLRGVTQTMPLAVYMALESDLEGAVTLAIILVAISAGLLWGLRRLRSGLFWSSDDAVRRAD
jgi:molybdate transport system permease protein